MTVSYWMKVWLGEYRGELMKRQMHQRKELKHPMNKLLIVSTLSEKVQIHFKYNTIMSEFLKIYFVVMVLG